MEKRIYKLMDAKGRVLIPKELRVETGIGYGDIVALEIADGKVTLRKVTVIEPGDQSPETVEAFVRAAFRTMPDRLRLSLISDLSGLLNEEKIGMNKKWYRQVQGPNRSRREKRLMRRKENDVEKRKKWMAVKPAVIDRRGNWKNGIVSFCWQGQELWQRHF